MGFAAKPRLDADLVAPVRVVNAQGRGPFVIVCDHASNRIPPACGDLGVPQRELVRHIAWDPGALAVSLRLRDVLDAPVVHSTVSRLVIDCNRNARSETLMPTVSEFTQIPGNQMRSPAERTWRIATYHQPYHEAIDALLAQRDAESMETILVCMHSFTPVYMGEARPWPIGVLPPPVETFSSAVFEALQHELPEAPIGWHQPYAGGKGVSYTVDRHGEGRDATMIEIRHDEILEPAGVALWADRLARCLDKARVALKGPDHLSSPVAGGIRLQGRD